MNHKAHIENLAKLRDELASQPPTNHRDLAIERTCGLADALLACAHQEATATVADLRKAFAPQPDKKVTPAQS